MRRSFMTFIVLMFLPCFLAQAEEQVPSGPLEGAGEQTVTVLPEVACAINLSSSDVNRIACPQDQQIQDVVYSQEKGVKVKYAGPNAFVKFLYPVKNGVEAYATKPVEFFIVCGENVYNLIASPKRIPSQTVRLSSGKLKEIKQNASLMAGLPLEKKTLTLIRLAATDTLPPSFDIANLNKHLKLFKGLGIELRRTVLVEGEGLRLKEYYVTNENSGQPGVDDTVRLTERDFMLTDLTTNTLAIALDKLNIRKGDTARLFIVESTGGSAANVD